jgi:hypothetical protein
MNETVTVKTNQGDIAMTPLEFAVYLGRADIVKLLLSFTKGPVDIERMIQIMSISDQDRKNKAGAFSS